MNTFLHSTASAWEQTPSVPCAVPRAPEKWPSPVTEVEAIMEAAFYSWKVPVVGRITASEGCPHPDLCTFGTGSPHVAKGILQM